MSTLDDLLADLIFLYGEKTGHATFACVKGLIERYHPTISKKVASHLSERDAILITYGDQVQKPGEAPLHTLAEFFRNT